MRFHSAIFCFWLTASVLPAAPPNVLFIADCGLAPLLSNSQAEWPHAAITHLDKPENYALSSQRWRYIHYVGGEEELYDIETDPHEWIKLAAKLAEMRSLAPYPIQPVHKSKP